MKCTIALLFWTYTVTRIGKDRMRYQKQPVYIHELNEYSMIYYIIFWVFSCCPFGSLDGTRRPGYPEERVRIFLASRG